MEPAVLLNLCTQTLYKMQDIHTYNFNGKRALIRVDFNVPLDKQTMEITDDTRIRAAIPTIQHILDHGGSVVLMSHLGRPKTGDEPEFSLKHIVNHTSKLLGTDVKFAGDCVGAEAFGLTRDLQPGNVVLLDNVRYHKEETAGDRAFAEKLSKHGDVYVNDAFGTAHRAHASTTVVAEFFPNDKMFGFLIEREIKSVAKVLESDEKPVTAIVGGAKVSSKITIIERLLDKVDYLIVGGGMAYTFVKATGGNVGASLVEDDYLDLARKLLKDAEAKGVKFYVPVDTVIADKFDNNANRKEVAIDAIPEGWMGLDIGNQSLRDCQKILEASKVILWNGPMGVFEMKNFQHGTAEIALTIAAATKGGAFSLIGGGDSVAAINTFNLADEVSHVSTGGGAMLEYLEGKILPGIAAIKN
jgi:phosphoglycerate kinase